MKAPFILKCLIVHGFYLLIHHVTVLKLRYAQLKKKKKKVLNVLLSSYSVSVSDGGENCKFMLISNK